MNKQILSKTYRPILSLLLVIFTIPGIAQVPVVDATRNRPPSAQNQNQQSPVLAQSPVQAQAPSDTSANNDVVMNLYLQLEQLQREVQNLRGIVEEQSYQIREMQNEQRDRYLDLDRRLSGIQGGTGQGGQGVPPSDGASPPGAAGNGVFPPPADNQAVPLPGQQRSSQGQSGAANPVTVNTPPDSNANINGGNASVSETDSLPAPTPENEQEIYRSALNMLLEESRYDEAIAGFGRYIDSYPNGRYLANAYYWQGEALILVQRYPQAETAFRKVLDDYPADPKAADAMLKLGVVYSQTGNAARARETWQGIRSRYPQNLATIRAAEDYLSRL